MLKQDIIILRLQYNLTYYWFSPEWLDFQKKFLDSKKLNEYSLVGYYVRVVKLADALDSKSYGSKLEVNIRLI